jgi:hypothetical protein
MLGIAFMVALLSRINRNEGIVLLGTMAIALANWIWVRKRE